MENGTKIKVLAAVFLIGFCLSSKGAFAPQILTTNFVQGPPVDGYLLTTLNGFPTFEPPGQPAVIQTNFIAYTTNFYINNNIVSNYFITNVFTVTAISNYFQTFNSFITTNVTVTNTFITNYLTQSTTVVSNLTLQMISTNNYVSNYFQTNIFNSITQVITNSDLWWSLNPLTGAITNVNGGGVSIGPGTNGASQVYLFDSSGTFVIGGFDTNAHAGFFGPGIIWTNDLSNPGTILWLYPVGYQQVQAQNTSWQLNDGLQYDLINGVRSDINSSGTGTKTNAQTAFTVEADGPNENSTAGIQVRNDDFFNNHFAYFVANGVTNNYYLGEHTPVGDGLIVPHFKSPTNSPAVSQLLQASSTAGDSKWADVNQIITNVTFSTINVTNLNVTNINSQTTINNTNIFNLSKGSTLILTNGFSPGFQIINTPNSQGTNWILDASQASYFTILATNSINIQYVTNTLPAAHGITGAAVSLRILPNGANRQFSVNTNFVLLQTNIWTLNTSVNPGVWWTTITNAQDNNGPRALLASFVVFDSAFNPTNCLVNALMSP